MAPWATTQYWQPGEFADAADVLLAVGVRVAEVAAQSEPHRVAIEQVAVQAAIEQACLKPAGDGGFSGGAEPGQPDRAGLLTKRLRPVALFNLPKGFFSGRHGYACRGARPIR